MDDHKLQDDVEAELDWDNAVNSAQVGISVTDGTVTVSGVVSSWPEKQAAIRAVKRVRGVQAIADELQVHMPGVSGHDDTDIARAADHALTWETNVPEGAVTATVSGRALTLEGTVTWEFQRQAAERAVEGIKGVRAVRNAIVLATTPGVDDVHDRIREALVRDATVEADRITVATEGHDVHLRGRVHSWAEREAAERAAWSAPGVGHVHNHLRLG